jgi:hypothetical protein
MFSMAEDRTNDSEVRKRDLDNGIQLYLFHAVKLYDLHLQTRPFRDVKRLIETLFWAAIVVGHSLQHGMNVCMSAV